MLNNIELGNLAFLIPQSAYLDAKQVPTEQSVKAIEDYVLMDATTDYGTTLSASITSNPVSNKTDKSDHYRVQNQQFSLSGVVSTSTLDVYNWEIKPNGSLDRPQQYVKKITDLVKSKSLVSVYMPHGMSATNCMITSVALKKVAPKGNLLSVNIKVKQLEVVTTSVGVTTVTRKNVQPEKDAATQSTEKVPDQLGTGVTQ